MRKFIILIFVFTGTVIHSFAQKQLAILKGTVLDSYGIPVKGVEIRLKNTAEIVLSSDSGTFEIKGHLGDVLIFSSTTFNKVEKKVFNTNPLVIKLVERYLQTLKEVDVLYEKKLADNILGSVATIYSNQLVTTPAPLYAYSLAGRIAGLYSQQTSGWTNTSINPVTYNAAVFGQFPTPGTVGLNGPSDNTEISLRLRGQIPVTMVDGVQRDIYSIPPENIESVSVLKDALSTLLLGQKSSGGVILVTTKKPTKGAPHLSFTAQTGLQTPLNLPTPLPAYKYAYLKNEALLNDANTTAYKEEDFKAYRTGDDPFLHPDVNWFNTILKDNAVMKRYDLNIAGGGTAARYAVGVGYFQQDGLLASNNTEYNSSTQIKRYTINTNINVDITPRFNAQLQIYGRVQDGNQPGATTNAIITSLFNTPNNAYPVFNPDGSLGGSQSFTNNLYGMVNSSGYITDYTRDITANILLNYKLDKWVKGMWAKLQTNLSVYGSNAADRSKTSPVFGLVVDESGNKSYSRYGSNTDLNNVFLLSYSAQYWYLQGALGYDKKIGKHGLATKIFYDQRQSIFNFDLPQINQNIAATASYDFNNKYFVDAALNNSGNSRFPPGKRFGWFYAAGLGWDISKENFIKDNSSMKWINKLKIRSTYGLTGNARPGYFGWRESYATNFYLPPYPFGGGRTINSYVLSQSTFANPLVTWEKANKFNVGLDISAFDNHIQFTTEYYSNRYYDIMEQRGKQSAIIGIQYPIENIGVNRYSGTEFSLTYQNNCKNFNYFLTANTSIEQSKVLFMDEINSYPWNARTGQPVGMVFGYKADGFIQTQQEALTNATVAGWKLQPGDLKLTDMNGDGTINMYDQQPIGTTKPMIFYGITFGGSFKGFDVSILLQGVQNRTYLLGGDYSFGVDGKRQSSTYTEGRWIPESAATASYPRLTAGFNNNNDYNTIYGTNANSFWVHSGDYFRIKNVDFGYSLPNSLIKHFKISSLRFFVNGLNLFTRAAFDRVDPEVNGQVYPIQKVVNVGVNLKF